MSKDTLLHDLQECQPRPSSFFVVRNIGLALLLLVLSVVSIFSLATFFRDLYVLQITYRIFEVLPLAVLSSGLFELLVTSFAFFLIGYFLYRTTDWCLVRRTRILLIIMLLSGLAFSSLLAFTSALNSALDGSRREITRLPYRSRRTRNLERQLRSQGYIVGQITAIDTHTQSLTLDTLQGPVNLTYTDLPPRVQVGDTVRVRAQETRIIRLTPIPVQRAIPNNSF